MRKLFAQEFYWWRTAPNIFLNTAKCMGRFQSLNIMLSYLIYTLYNSIYINPNIILLLFSIYIRRTNLTNHVARFEVACTKENLYDGFPCVNKSYDEFSCVRDSKDGFSCVRHLWSWRKKLRWFTTKLTISQVFRKLQILSYEFATMDIDREIFCK